MFNDLPKGDFIDETPSLPPYFHLPAARRTYIGGINLQVNNSKGYLPLVLHESVDVFTRKGHVPLA